MALSAEQRAARVAAIVFDVDGVLTRGDIVYGPEGEWKSFNVQDGLGFELARRFGIRTAILSGRESNALAHRAMDLHVTVLRQGVKDKTSALRALVKELGVGEEEVCYVGDDLPDLGPMKQVGFPVAVQNAVEDVKKAAVVVTQRAGGEGAAREVIEFVLKAKGLWPGVIQESRGAGDE